MKKKHQGNEGENKNWCVYDIVEAKDSFFLNVCQQPDYYYKKKEKDLFNINVRC